MDPRGQPIKTTLHHWLRDEETTTIWIVLLSLPLWAVSSLPLLPHAGVLRASPALLTLLTTQRGGAAEAQGHSPGQGLELPSPSPFHLCLAVLLPLMSKGTTREWPPPQGDVPKCATHTKAHGGPAELRAGADLSRWGQCPCLCGLRTQPANLHAVEQHSGSRPGLGKPWVMLSLAAAQWPGTEEASRPCQKEKLWEG